MDNKKQHLFDNPKNVKRLMTVFYAICALLVVLDFVIKRKIYHSWENLWGFYPIYGFVGCVVLVFVASWMRTFLMRPENYYENLDQPKVAEPNPVTTGDNNVDA